MAEEKNEEKKDGIDGVQKAAIFMILLGEEKATEIFKRMGNDEIRKVATAMSHIDKIEPELLNSVLEEFIESFNGESRLIIEGESYMKNVLNRALDKDQADAVFREVEEQRRDLPFDWSRRVNIATLANYVEGEHPQTVAMILAHLPPEVSSDILMAIPDEKKGDIAMRVAQLGQIPEEIVRDVDDALKQELAGAAAKGSKGGGLQVLVDILNGVDKSTEEIVMELIEEEQTEMATSIREMMFVFEDLVRVDDKAMREILKKVEGQQLTLALKTATEDMKQKILSNLSSRASEMLLEDLEVMGPVKLSDVEEAQQEIVRAAKELEAEGTIVLGGKGKDDVLV